MKKVIFIFAIIVSIAACKNEDKKTTSGSTTELTAEEKERSKTDSSNFTSIQWLDSTFLDLGKVKKGETVEVSFRFKNTGNKQLVIADVSAGCGCTIPEKPQQPFAPGEEGVIKAKFESKNQNVGPHQKPVYVTANTNTPNPILLNFKVEITE
ncbi:hypothetical protein CAP36_01885 [Chitinophagaceae bacterium IBVUCB2]|nr:hypothetical protein CAP36_01885 [Chitinophagaceae bacterium IBVUCB2]